jgi:hypothetical protein
MGGRSRRMAVSGQKKKKEGPFLKNNLKYKGLAAWQPVLEHWLKKCKATRTNHSTAQRRWG